MGTVTNIGRFKPIPDPVIVKKLRRIDPDLSVVWMDAIQRWAIFHDLQVPGNWDQTIDLLARDLAKSMRAEGYEVPFHECQAKAAEQAKSWKLVCYVTEDDGAYRPLDGRIVEKIARMNWLRENVGLSDWRALLNAKADAARAAREKQQDHIWEETKRDKVFAHCLSNILWGVEHPLHVQTGMGKVAG